MELTPSLLILISAIFFIGLIAIILEPIIRINKTASALLMCCFCWLVVFLNTNKETAYMHLSEEFVQVGDLTIFVLTTFVIIEILQAYGAFDIVTNSINLKSKRAFLWVIALITFFLSTIIANVTATLLMLVLANKFLTEKKDKMLIGGAIVIASNAGGVWSPIGDVTTTLLWIGNRISTLPTIENLFLPSFISTMITLLILTPFLKGNLAEISDNSKQEINWKKNFLFFAGILALLMIPALYEWVDFPPYLGGIFAIGFMLLITDLLYSKDLGIPFVDILSNIDVDTFLFLFGLLLSVGALHVAGALTTAELALAKTHIAYDYIAIMLGMASAMIDNVPIVSASLGMFDVKEFPLDFPFWQLLAYTTGTGGSLLIIGSPAGIAYMNKEKVSFFWYLKYLTGPVLVGFLCGALTYIFLFE